jgi:hypothetical protein
MAENKDTKGTEVATRSAGGQEVEAVRGFYSTAEALQQAFRGAAAKANLLSPVVRIDHIPAMHSVSLRMVVLNPQPPDNQGRGGGGDVYLPDLSRPGEFALTKVALDKVAAAAGISWDPILSGRMDDSSDTQYARFRAAGWITDFDGSRRCISAEREMDLREGSATAAAWQAKGWNRRLEMAREFILPQVESKARNRAIRQALAIKSKYTAEEIARPFVVPKLVLDLDQISDPEIRTAVALKIADRSLGASERIYGSGPEAPSSLGAAPRDMEQGRIPPPPLGASREAEDENGGETDADNPASRIPF